MVSTTPSSDPVFTPPAIINHHPAVFYDCTIDSLQSLSPCSHSSFLHQQPAAAMAPSFTFPPSPNSHLHTTDIYNVPWLLAESAENTKLSGTDGYDQCIMNQIDTCAAMEMSSMGIEKDEHDKLMENYIKDTISKDRWQLWMDGHGEGENQLLGWASLIADLMMPTINESSSEEDGGGLIMNPSAIGGSEMNICSRAAAEIDQKEEQLASIDSNLSIQSREECLLEMDQEPQMQPQIKSDNEINVTQHKQTTNTKKRSRTCKETNNLKVTEAPPNVVHVRACRGQATDSHSLAERVRREKINQRMKVLQEIVPGCHKVVGKAMMLEEIINYIKSLQEQVEFLSMKLAIAHQGQVDLLYDN